MSKGVETLINTFGKMSNYIKRFNQKGDADEVSDTTLFVEIYVHVRRLLKSLI